MLSKPNVKEILPKVGNRYQSVLALSKRARQIEKRRLDIRNNLKERKVERDSKEYKELDEECLNEAVNQASEEIAQGKVYIKINGEYTITPESEMEREIREMQMAASTDNEEVKE